MKLFSIRNYIVIILLSIIPLFPMLTNSGLLHTHDGMVHLVRMAQYYKALMDGQILPRWAGDLNYGYGLPLFNFMYHLPYLLSSILIQGKFSLAVTFKIVIALSYIISAIGIYSLGLAIFKKNKIALLIAVFYQFAPFRFVEMFVRGSFGEIFTYAFIPWVLFALYKLLTSNRLAFFLLSSLMTFFLIISHNSISLVMFVCAMLFIILFRKSLKDTCISIASCLVGLSAAAFYWIPALLEHKYTYGDLFMKNMFRSYFPPIQNLFIPNLTNSPALQNGGVSVQIGLFHSIALIIACYLFFMKRKSLSKLSKQLILFSLLLSAGAIFLMQPLSVPLWEQVSLLRQFQFPWRFLSVVNLSTALAAIVFLELKIFAKPWIYWMIIALTVISTIKYWVPPLGYDKITDESYYWNYPLNTTYFGETDVIWSAGPAKKYPANRVEIIDGKASISDFYKKSNIHTYSVYAESDARLVDNTQYFPGWRVYVDNAKTPVEFQDQNWRGLITYSVTKGTHSVRIVFEKSKIQYVAELISLLTICMTTFVALILKRRKFL